MIPKSKTTAELDIKTLQQLAEIGRMIVENPIKVMLTKLEPGRIYVGLEAHQSVEFVWTTVDSIMGAKGSVKP